MGVLCRRQFVALVVLAYCPNRSRFGTASSLETAVELQLRVAEPYKTALTIQAPIAPHGAYRTLTKPRYESVVKSDRPDVDETQYSSHERTLMDALQRSDRLVVRNQEPPLGAHLVTARRGYLHHGIYVGDGNVVHYPGIAHGLCSGPVEEVPLSSFACRRCVWIRSGAPSDFKVPEVIERARSRVGEDCYRLLTNNCEHFCEWCLHGVPRSFQVEAWRAWPRQMLREALRVPLRSFSHGRLIGARGESPIRGKVKPAHMH